MNVTQSVVRLVESLSQSRLGDLSDYSIDNVTG